MHPDELLDALRRETDAMARLAGEADPATDVPSCPGWTIQTVINHCGRVHRWAAAIVRDGATDRPEFPPRPPVIDRAWFEDGARELLDALTQAEPDADAWNHMGQAPKVRFWIRRQAHETAIHRWDVDDAAHPGAAEPVETELAIDGIDELLDVILPRAYEGGDLGGTVHLHATDSPHGEWLVRTSGGELLVGHDHQKGDAAVRGTASDLLLWLWGRRGLDSALEVFGDPALAVRLTEVLRAP
ncbi:MAG TPA: maleylpyruvate isomerase family mycothiol-dependent enzyme [Acidimicrobiales bacterium]|nr:maleylpyruvate isomerase family mycothiol-dependent enzyme [Acidimicrobiales bacterium]